MRVPQVNERVKEAPAHVLRAMFAGIGQLLSVSDKILNKSAPAHTGAEPPETAAPEPGAPETGAPETGAPETVAAETATPETVAAETVEAETAAPETVAAETAAETVGPEAEPDVAAAAAAGTAPAAATAGTALPVPNYDELTIASLRARLRNLSADQLGELIDYEKAHAARADVISMFERRIAKLTD